MLRRIYANNYRCLVNFELKPERVNLLVGANGSGKTTFLEVLSSLRTLITGGSAPSVFTQDTLPWWDARNVQSFELDIDGPSSSSRLSYRVSIAHGQDGATISEESLLEDGTPVASFKAGQVRLHLANKPTLEFAYAGKQSILSAGFAVAPALQAFLAAMNGTAYFRLNPWVMQGSSPGESSGLLPDGSNFVAWLRSFALDAPSNFSTWISDVAQALPHFSNIRLADLGGTRALMGVVPRAGDGEREVPFNFFSEGEKCLVALHAIAARRERATALLLDEPDNFLSLKELQPVLHKLTDQPSPQLFIVTHHPDAIDYLAAETTWLFSRRRGEHVRVAKMDFDRSKGEQPAVSVQLEMG